MRLVLAVCAATALVSAPCRADSFAESGQLLDQRYVMDAGGVGAFSDLTIEHLAAMEGAITIRGNQEGLHLGGSYGVTTRLTAGVDYAAPVAGDGTDSNTRGRGPLRVFAMLLAADTDRLTVTGSTDLEDDLCGGPTMAGACSSIRTLHVGVGLKVKVGSAIALFTGAPFGPAPAGQQLSVRLDAIRTIDLALPVGVAVQATPQLFTYAETQLALFRLANAGGADRVSPIFSDSENGGLGVPAELGCFYGVSKTLHVGATLDVQDVLHAGDLYKVFLGARLFQR